MTDTIYTKLNKATKEIGGKIGFDAKNPHFKNDYVSLSKTLEVVVPALEAQGLALLQMPSALGEAPALTTIIYAVDSAEGEAIQSTTPLVMDKQTPQAQGACITYIRRYALHAMLGLVGEKDDDAQSAMSDSPRPARRRTSNAGSASGAPSGVDLDDALG